MSFDFRQLRTACILVALLALVGCASIRLGTARAALTVSERDAEELIHRAGPGRGEFTLPGGKRATCGAKGCVLRWKTQPGLFDGDRAVGTTALVKGQASLSTEDLVKLKKLLVRSQKAPLVVEDMGWRLTCADGMCLFDVPFPLKSEHRPPSEKRTGEAFRALVVMSEDAP